MQQETSTEKFKVHLRILDKKKKSKFVHFELTDIPKFTFAEELKEYLLQKYSNLMQPAENTSFQIGYFIEGRGNKKFHIVDARTLQSAYDTEVDGQINLWVDPHVEMSSSMKKESNKRKREKRKCRMKLF